MSAFSKRRFKQVRYSLAEALLQSTLLVCDAMVFNRVFEPPAIGKTTASIEIACPARATSSTLARRLELI